MTVAEPRHRLRETAAPRAADHVSDEQGAHGAERTPGTLAFCAMDATGAGMDPASGGAGPGAALEARGIVKRYGRQPALRGVDFEAHPGELLAVIGPNGAGKTTLLSILAGIVRADQGEIHLPRGEVGWVPQQAALYRRLTVEENLLLFARLEGHEDPRASVEEMLGLAGLQ